MKSVENAVIFDRVSSADQRDGFSLEAQRGLASKYVADKKLRVLRDWSVDESAANHADRKHFFQMLEYVRTNRITHVIFDKIDRAVRNLESAVEIEKLIKSGVKFHFVREHLIIDDESPSHEKMRFYLGLILATYYIDNLRSEIRKGLDTRTEQGLWNHVAPFGYKNIRQGRANRAVVIHDEIEAPIAKEVFELFATGNYPLDALVSHIKAKVTNRTVTKRLIETMLNNPFYIGYLPSRKSRGTDRKGAHEPLISRSLWDQVQKVKGIRAMNHQGSRSGAVPKPLMGLFRCGVCNHSVTGEQKRKASGKVFIYYRCANLKCEQKRKNTPQAALMGQIEAAFEPFARFTPEATKAFIESLHGRLEDLDLYTRKMSGELAEKRIEIKRSIEKLELLHAAGVLTDTELTEVRRIKESTLNEVKLEIAAYNEADNRTFKKGLRLIELLASVRNYMQRPGNELEKVRLAKLVLSNPILKDGTIQFSYQKPFDVLLDLSSKENWWRTRKVPPAILLQTGQQFSQIFTEILAA